MRPLLTGLLLCSFLPVCQAQPDSTRRAEQPDNSPQKQVLIPGIDSPISAPGTLLQSSPQPNVQPSPKPGRKRLKTAPPANPRAFGVGIPIGKTKKDKQ